MTQLEFKAITHVRRKARENAHVQVVVGFGIASHWLRKWREFCWPIIERNNVTPKQTQLPFDTQMNTAPLHFFLCCVVFLFPAAQDG